MDRKVDAFTIVSNSDIKLVKYLLRSYQVYFKIPGDYHLLFFKKDRKIAESLLISFPFVKIHYVDSLGFDEYRSQMYYKMKCFEYTSSEWIIILDADNLFIDTISYETLISDKPQWNFSSWDKITSKWRDSCSHFLDQDIPFNFMACPPFIVNKNILQNLSGNYNLNQLNYGKAMLSEFIIYGGYAYKNFKEYYNWHDTNNNGSSFFKLINQIPPEYMVLDNTISLSKIRNMPNKYYGVVFWSHWDQAEKKMREFLLDSLKDKSVLQLSEDEDVYLPITIENMLTHGLSPIKGTYKDFWLKEKNCFNINSKKTGIAIFDMVSSHNCQLNITNNNQFKSVKAKGHFQIKIPIHKKKNNKVKFKFSSSNINNRRELFALLSKITFDDRDHDISKNLVEFIKLSATPERISKMQFRLSNIRLDTSTEDIYKAYELIEQENIKLKLELTNSQRDLDSLYRRYGHSHYKDKKNKIALFYRIKDRLINIFKPRIGKLSQYLPSDISSLNTISSTDLTSHPKISIVTPSFNQGKFIERTIKSVISQDYPNLQYYIQDNNSSDETIDILNKYKNELSGFKSESDSGQSNAINRAFSNCDGDIMAWLNSDDVLIENCLNRVIDIFNKYPNVDVVYGKRLMIDENDYHIGRWVCPGHDKKSIYYADYIPQETMFWRRSIWNKIGGELDESLSFAMDWDFILKLQENNAKFYHLNRFLGLFRVHHSQKTNSIISNVGYKEMQKLRKKYLNKTLTPLSIKKKTIKYLFMSSIYDIIVRIRIRLGKEV